MRVSDGWEAANAISGRIRDSLAVSAQHAVVTLAAPNRVSIRQVKSSNGTRVFKSRASTDVATSGLSLEDGGPPESLGLGSVIELGSTLLELVSMTGAPDSNAPPVSAATSSSALPPVSTFAEQKSASNMPAHGKTSLAAPQAPSPLQEGGGGATVAAGRVAESMEATEPEGAGPSPLLVTRPLESFTLSPLLAAALEIGAARSGPAGRELYRRAATTPADASGVLAAARASDLAVVLSMLRFATEALKQAHARAEPLVPRGGAKPQLDIISLSDSSPSPPRGESGRESERRDVASPSRPLAVLVGAPPRPPPKDGGAAVGKRVRKVTLNAPPPRLSKARQLTVDALAVAPAGSVTAEGGAKKRRKQAGGAPAAAVAAASDLVGVPELAVVEGLFPRWSQAPEATDVAAGPGRDTAAAEGMLLPPSRVGAAAAGTSECDLWTLAGVARNGSRPAHANQREGPSASPVAQLSPSFLPPPFTQSAYDTELLGGHARVRRPRAAAASLEPAPRGPGHGHAQEAPHQPRRPRVAESVLPSPGQVQGARREEPAVPCANLDRGTEEEGDLVSDADSADSPEPLPAAAQEFVRATSPAGLAAIRASHPDYESIVRFICGQTADRLRAGRDAMSNEVATAAPHSAESRALRFFAGLADALLRDHSPFDIAQPVVTTRASVLSQPATPQSARSDPDKHITRIDVADAHATPVGVSTGAQSESNCSSSRLERMECLHTPTLAASFANAHGSVRSSGAPQIMTSPELAAAADLREVRSMATPVLTHALSDYGVRPGPRAQMVEQLLEARQADRDLARASVGAGRAVTEEDPAAGAAVGGPGSAHEGSLDGGADLRPSHQLALMIRSRRELHEAVLLFETQPLSALGDAARAAGITLAAPALKAALSDLGVSVAVDAR